MAGSGTLLYGSKAARPRWWKAAQRPAGQLLIALGTLVAVTVLSGEVYGITV